MNKPAMFSRESEMTRIVDDWLNSQGFFTKLEFVFPWGICDVVACEVNRTHVLRRIRRGQKASIGSHSNVLLLSMIPYEGQPIGITISDLEDTLQWSRNELEQRIQFLRRRRFVDESPAGEFKSRVGWCPIHRRLMAIELKLKDISGALIQARSNQGVTRDSFVAFPESVANRIVNGKRKREFADSGVGVISVNDSSCEFLLNANGPLDRISATQELHAVEKFWTRAKQEQQ
ncbi:hypothetical protein KOR42_23860 [Thalassoglobus neptunius]|uniref:Uncharacterized protein n=1 Tax=Thalassoglobus neptunius TaxID=1938619 RepID=A0A5C5X8F3_9PLAN|nr:hypothetical protein KOR42_23860 [Thalassoglobus neptunius]